MRPAAWPILAIAALALTPLASAHTDVTIHQRYGATLGWLHEPPVVDSENAVFLKLVDTGAAAGGHGGHDEGHGGHGSNATDPNAHGAIFGSGDLDRNATFVFNVTHAHMGMTIPFHDHYDHSATGTIKVRMDAPTEGTVHVSVKNGAFEPHMLDVKPGTSILWTNMKTAHAGAAPFAKVVSGVMGGGHGDANATGVQHAHRTLKVEVTTGGESRVFDLKPHGHAESGEYVARFIPSASGVYKVRLFGTLHDMPVNVTREIESVRASTLDKWPAEGPSTEEAAEVIAEMEAEIAEKTSTIARKDAEIGQRSAELATLKAEKAELEAQTPFPGVALLIVALTVALLFVGGRRR